MSGSICGDFLGDFLGFGAFDEPPDAVPLRILGLDAMPVDESALRLAFVRKVCELHPDLNPLEEASWREVHGEEWEAVQWARVVLLRKLPRVTTKECRDPEVISRYACKGGCGKERGLYYRGHWRGYCWSCATDARNALDRERRRLARVDRVCEGCGAKFTPARSDARYCSNGCRQAGYRERRLGGVEA